jgi:protease I
MVNAGAKWVDQPVTVDGNLITSRKPDDLTVFMKEILRFYQ